MAVSPAFSRFYHLSLGTRLAEMEQACTLPPAQLAERQAALLAGLLREAAANVPFYRRLLESHPVIDRSGRLDRERFARLPSLSKDLLRTHQADLIARPGFGGARWNSSGGSTGEPVRILQDRAHRDTSRAAKVLFDGWSGYAFGQPRVVLWGSRRDSRAHGAWWRPALRRLKNETWLDAFHMGPADLDRYADTIRRVRPVNILGYAESLHELARHLLARGETLPPCDGIVTTAGTLHDDARDAIGRALGGPVFNRYGSRETGEMASECRAHDGLHVSPLTHLVEIVRPDGSPCAPGERGEILVTSLVNQAMPLIRYRIGDEAAFASGECGCGCSWPRLVTVYGRTTDHLVSRRHGRIHGGALRFILNDLDWVRTYQVVQQATGDVIVSLVPLSAREGPTRVDRDGPMLRARIAALLDDGCSVSLELVDRIPATASGKRRHVISHVPMADSPAPSAFPTQDAGR